MNPNVAADEKWIALLGKRNFPLDGVEDYCTFLAAALREHGIDLQLQRVSWETIGWDTALAELAAKSADWRGRWVLLQYTALAWSARGFPLRAMKAMNVLRRGGARVAVVFHEFTAQTGGQRLIQPVRTACQNFVIRRLHDRADRSVFTVPLARVPWLRSGQDKAAFIPIGANIPELAAVSPFATEVSGAEPIVGPTAAEGAIHFAPAREKTVAVFCFSEDGSRFHEAEDILFAVREAQTRIGRVHLLLIGRSSEEMGPALAARLADAGVRVSVKGALPAPEVTTLLAQASVQLFVRGPISQTRGSVLAGVACGLPIVGYEGMAAGTPLEEAGIHLVHNGDRQALAEALCIVLQNDALRRELQKRSLRAQRNFFSWRAIGDRYAGLRAFVAPEPLRARELGTQYEARP